MTNLSDYVPALKYGADIDISTLDISNLATLDVAGTLTVDGASTLTGATTQTGLLTCAASIAVTGAVTATTAVTSSGATSGIGYATGAGGAVTQATNKQTGVTLNTVAGTVTTNNEALAAAAETTFTVTNSAVAITDVVVLSIQSGGTSGEYLAHVTDVGAGSFDITLANMSASSASDVVLINFAVIKGVVA